MVVFGVRRRPWSVAAAVLGLVGSLLVVGSPPVSGVAGEADNEPRFSACVGPALESQGLVDVVGSFAEDAVNCLAHFGVTRGRTETTYDPGGPVLRWQMALFLARAAGPAGVALPANPETAFTDTVGLFEEARTAVAQMAALGVMRGRSSTSFQPDAPVSRAEMAEMLDSFLVEAEKASGLGLGALGGGGAALSDVSADDEVFSDIGGVTRGQYAAVRRMFEAGVARGTADGLFNPGGLVTRAQMAVFITRMLAHTVARPAGLTLQADVDENPINIAVSVRDNDLAPMPDVMVDVFSAAEPDEAFGADGRCSADDVLGVGGSELCEISFGDQLTDPSGDAEIAFEQPTESRTVWAWTGEVGDVYNAEVDAPSVRILYMKPGVKLRITDDMAENQTAAKFGDRVTFTLQVVDEDDEPVASEDVEVAVAVSETTVNAETTPATETTVSFTRTYKTDESGAVELSFRHTDPRSGSSGDMAYLDLDIRLLTPAEGAPLTLEDKTALEKAAVEAGSGADDAAAVWRDSAPVPASLKLSHAAPFAEATETGQGAASTVLAAVTDQFGDPVSRVQVSFFSDDPDGIGTPEGAAFAYKYDNPGYGAGRYVFETEGNVLFQTGEAARARQKTTNRSGVASMTYSRDSSKSGIETIWAVYTLATPQVRGAADDSDDRPDGDPDDVTELTDQIEFYWAEEAEGPVTGRLLVKDTDNNRLVIFGAEDVLLVDYDDNDHFNGADGAPIVFADFEKALEADGDESAEHLRVDAYSDTPRSVSSMGVRREWPVDYTDAEDGSVAADNGVVVVGDPWSYAPEGADYPINDDRKPSTPPGSPTNCDSRAGRVWCFDGGKAFIYENGLDGERIQIYSPVPRYRGRFGYDVDIKGDTIVISEPGQHHSRDGSSGRYVAGRFDGRVFVYQKAASQTWRQYFDSICTGGPLHGSPGWCTPTATLTDEDAVTGITYRTTSSYGSWNAPDNEFGEAVALSGDGSRIAVSAPFESRITGDARIPGVSGNLPSAQGGLGMIRVFNIPASGEWADDDAPDATLTLKDFYPSDGSWSEPGRTRSLSISDDGSVVVVGAQLYNDLSFPPGAGSGNFSVTEGRAFVFQEASPGDWDAASDVVKPAAALAAPEQVQGLWFGISVGVSGDGTTVAVGVDDKIPSEDTYGAVYAFSDSDWSDDDGRVTAELRPAKARYDETFGSTVAVSPDGTQIIGGRRHRWEGDFRGSVVLFNRDGAAWTKHTGLDEEYLGADKGFALGWLVTFDRTTGDIYATNVQIPVPGRDDSASAIRKITP